MNRSNNLDLTSVPLFSNLSDAQREKIAGISLIHTYEKGEIVFYEGDESRYFHLLLSGEVSVFKSSGTDQTIMVHRFRAPSLIAEVATLKQIAYPASAEAIRHSVLMKIQRDPFLELLSSDPSLSLAMITSLTQKISALENALQRHSAPNAAAKVARLLIDQIDLFSRMKGIEIAELLGITPETLSRTLKKFKEQSLIAPSKPKGYTATDLKKLNDIMENNYPLSDS